MQAKDLRPGWWFTFDALADQLRLCTFIGEDRAEYVSAEHHCFVCETMFHEEVTHHPDCTGWDWPIPKRVRLEVGKRYVMRCELLTEPVQKNASTQYPFSAWVTICGVKEWLTWTYCGKYHVEDPSHKYDIVSEYVEPEPVIDPGEGWRLLEDEEVVEDGDWHTSIDGRWCPCIGSVGMMVANIPNRWAIKAFRRRIPPAHVPFTQHTFRPHAKKWLYEKSMPDHWFRPQEIEPHAVLIGAIWVEWDRLLAGFEFVGGGVCGVKHG